MARDSQKKKPAARSLDDNAPRLQAAIICVLLGVVSQSLSMQSLLESQIMSSGLFSTELWIKVVGSLGGQIVPAGEGQAYAEIGVLPFLLINIVLTAVSLPLGGWCIAKFKGTDVGSGIARWGMIGWSWWCFHGVLELIRIAAFIGGLESLQAFLMASASMMQAATIGLWLASFAAFSDYGRSTNGNNLSGKQPLIPGMVLLVMVEYIVIFTAMNWQLYHNLLIPHGDSAMYEEHLWNFTHGKGFRSYLDQGLFWGEHIQFVHLFLIPFHALWPSHLMMELCESVALASGAIPVFRMARRHSQSKGVAVCLAVAYLAYSPMQFLDISIDFKTFRPISFGVPLLLFTLNAFEQRQIKRGIVLMLLTLSAKEDYAIVLAPLGLWLVWQAICDQTDFAQLSWKKRLSSVWNAPDQRKRVLFGFGLAVLATVYLGLVVTVIIPGFRDGADVHYTRYFSDFGSGPVEIVTNMLTKPQLLLGKLFSVSSIMFGLALMLPIAGLPCFSPSRLLVAAPLFVISCLNEIAQDPRHHFHAPLVPILFWAATAGLPQTTVIWNRWRQRRDDSPNDNHSEPMQLFGYATVCMSICTAVVVSVHPFSLNFWDPGTRFYWRTAYAVNERATEFDKLIESIPPTAKVACTDYVHTRFTHHERSYDYSNYPRRVSNNQPLRAPDDTDFIVIDTGHYYSEIKTPNDITEYREQRNQWELLPDSTNGYFIVLKRKW